MIGYAWIPVILTIIFLMLMIREHEDEHDSTFKEIIVRVLRLLWFIPIAIAWFLYFMLAP